MLGQNEKHFHCCKTANKAGSDDQKRLELLPWGDTYNFLLPEAWQTWAVLQNKVATLHLNQGINPGQCARQRRDAPRHCRLPGEELYFFYHNEALPDGGNFRRSICVDYLYYNPDGTIKPIVQTAQGVAPVK